MKIKALLITLLILTSSVFTIPVSHSATKGWRYWGYFQAAPGATKWTTAMTGPTVDVANGAVEGWSFVFSSDDVPSIPPKIKPNFKAICGTTKADPDTKRVALVIEFGSKAWAPKGEKPAKSIKRCVRTALDSQGIDVLGQVVKIRAASSGLICGLNGFPAKECGVEISTPAALIVKK
ncbi:MAG: SCO2322 family protein [Candidatus Planktophila sp.]|nr:SCO2322 family protein [Candidatus Planktophila sp.]